MCDETKAPTQMPGGATRRLLSVADGPVKDCTSWASVMDEHDKFMLACGVVAAAVGSAFLALEKKRPAIANAITIPCAVYFSVW